MSRVAGLRPVVVAVLTLAACGGSSPAVDGGPPCAAPCGSGCCGGGESCVAGECVPACARELCGSICCPADEDCIAGQCTPRCQGSCDNKQCGDDGCGVSCGDCLRTEQCTEAQRCEPTLITGNSSCQHAVALDFGGSTVARAQGRAPAQPGEVMLSCGPARNTAVVFSMSVPRPSALAVSVRSVEGSAIHPIVALQAECDPTRPELACAPSSADQSTASLQLPVTRATTYFIWVDATAGDPAGDGASDFMLTVELSTPTVQPPANDSCPTAALLELDATGRASVAGSTWAADDSASGACQGLYPGGNGRPDVVYAFDALAASSLVASVRLTGGGGGATDNRVALYLRDRCGAAASELACVQGDQTTPRAHDLSAGRYYLFVDSPSELGVDFLLTVHMGLVPPNDGCGHPTPLLLDSTGRATASGDTTFASSDTNGGGITACGALARDVVYSFELPAEKFVAATVRGIAPTPFSPVVYLVGSQCASQARLGPCGVGDLANGEEARRVGRLPAGTYYVWVDGTGAEQFGTFELTIEASDVASPAHDTCAGARRISLGTDGEASITDSTESATDDYSGNCLTGGPRQSGADLVYQFDLQEPSAVSISVAGAGAAGALWLPAVYLRRGACDGSQSEELACAAAEELGGPASIAVPGLAAGTYYLVVDGADQSAGEFALAISAGPPPVNDTCASPAAIAIDAVTGAGSATGDTRFAQEDGWGKCSGSGRGRGDLVFSFVLAETRAVRIAATSRTAGYGPALYLRTSCDLYLSEIPNAGCAVGTPSNAAELSLASLPAGTYFVWVDGAESGGDGAFQLTVQTLVPTGGLATGDDCSSPVALAFQTDSTSGAERAVAAGDTRGANDDAVGVGFCAWSFAGDVVYRFELTGAHKVSAKVVADPLTPGFLPYVYIRRACASGADSDMVACAADSGQAATATAVANALPPGTYFVVVDGVTAGMFSLEVTLETAVSAPANDNCSSAQAIALAGNSAVLSGTTVDAQNDAWATNFAGNNGPDVVYSLAVIDFPKKVEVLVTPTSTTFRPVVSVRSVCSDVYSELGRGTAAAAGQSTTATVAHAAPGTYFVWVDSVGTPTALGGNFTIQVTVGIDNEDCAGAAELVRGVVTGGTTVGARDDYGAGGFSAVCQSAIGSTALLGSEVVYSFSPTSMGPFTVRVEPAPGFDPAVWVTAAPNCAGTGGFCRAAANAAGAGQPEEVVVNGVAGAKYYVMIDAVAAGMAGNFTVTVR